MTKQLTVVLIISSILLLSSCSTPESKAKRLVLKEFDKGITEKHYALLETGFVTKSEIKKQIDKVIDTRYVSDIQSENGDYIVTIYSPETIGHEFKYRVSDDGTVTKLE